MDVLVLGGSVFLGRAVVAEAQAAGAKVTVFNRGQSGPAPHGAEQITGDRADPADLEQLAGRPFDVVVDTSGYVPADVARVAKLLAPTCDHYAFVSTINVFPGWPAMPDYHRGGVHEGDPDATREDAPNPEQEYGWLKAGCELAVAREFGPDRFSALRGGCIVGPHDARVGRLTWWIDRVARGGEVLAPGQPDDQVALVDSRDLARFALARPAGAFEVTGDPVPRHELLAACREATGSDATFTWVETGWLAEQDVEEWTEIPLWSAEPSIFRHDNAAAKHAGLPLRPIHQTVADTWAWQQAVPGGWHSSAQTPGLEPDKERQLLDAWRGIRRVTDLPSE